MSRKKRKEEPVEVIKFTPEPKPEPVVDPYLGVAYTVSSWKGLPNYECRFCAMATISRDDAIEHFTKEHCTSNPKERIVDTGIVDEDGATIMRVVPAEEV